LKHKIILSVYVDHAALSKIIIDFRFTLL